MLNSPNVVNAVKMLKRSRCVTLELIVDVTE